SASLHSRRTRVPHPKRARRGPHGQVLVRGVAERLGWDRTGTSFMAGIPPEQLAPSHPQSLDGIGALSSAPLSRGSGTTGKIPAQPQLPRRLVQFGLCKEKPMLRVGVWIEPDHDLRFFHRLIPAIVKRIPQILQYVQRAFVTCGISRISNNREHALV